MSVLWALPFGTFVGWIGSLLMHTGTSEGILVDIAVGASGAIALALLIGSSERFDNIVAGCLGAVIGLALLDLIRRFSRDGGRRGEAPRFNANRGDRRFFPPGWKGAIRRWWKAPYAPITLGGVRPASRQPAQ